MIKSLLLSLTLISSLSPLPFSSFNLLFTYAETTNYHEHTYCSHKMDNFGTNFNALAHKVIKENETNYQIRTVVIDPGHGGKDPGCSGAHSREKHIALGIGQSLRDQMQKAYPDLKIIMTRDSDEFIPLNERANIANRNQADLFISIHCNYIPKYFGTKGTETYVLGLHRAEDNLDVAKRENASILYEKNYEQTYDGFDPDSDEGHIVLSMYQNAFLDQSILFASLVENRFAEAAQRKSRGVKQAGFLVLRETTMPSVLVETGFLSNRSEEAYLRSAEGQQIMARSILEAFELYKNTVEGKPTKAVVANLETPMMVNSEEIPTENARANLPKKIEATPIEVRKSTPKQTAIPVATASSTTAKPSNSEAVSMPKVNVRPSNSNEDRNEPAYESPIQYRVQIAASKNRVDTRASKWNNIPYIVEVVWENEFHKYQILNLNSFEEADRVRIEMLHKGFDGAFIVAFKNGKKLSTKELSRIR